MSISTLQVATQTLPFSGTFLLQPVARCSCRRCGRPLSDPVSVQNGIGPICASVGGARSGSADERGDRCDLPFDPVTGDIVCRLSPDGTRSFNIRQRYTHHSPSGMEWGYGGSGPADFALNILTQFLPTRVSADDNFVTLWDGSTVPELIWELHQDFKWAFVAAVPAEGGVIPGDTIRAWLAEQERRLSSN